MRGKLFILLVVVVPCMVTLYAAYVPWDLKKAPPINIVDGYSRASKALDIQTKRYHCVEARIDGASWLYHFVSSTGKARWVVVEFNGATSIREHALVLH